ncbi:MAG: hypothetical protein R2822_05625 [Spirosomataceae bacterium]
MGRRGLFWIRYTDVPEYVKYGFQAYLSTGSDTLREEQSADIAITYPYKILDAPAIFQPFDLEQGTTKQKIAAFASAKFNALARPIK